MAPPEFYRRQVQLLIDVMPAVAAEPDLALKGGTAINLFVRDMPRLSVDIDLTFLPVAPRPASLAAIDAALRRMAAAIRRRLGPVRVAEVVNAREQTVTKLAVQRADAQIKIEVTPVLRGCVFAPEIRSVSRQVEEAFGFAEATVVSFPDLYAGKIVAALDRQHPRDLFDVWQLFAHEGVDAALRQAFLVFLVSHDRPIAEVIAPRLKDLTRAFAQGFEGMTLEAVALDELLAAREALIATMVGGMPDTHRQFLLGFKAGTPDWDLLGIPGAQDLPAVRWKQMNLEQLSPEARRRMLAKLETTLDQARGVR